MNKNIDKAKKRLSNHTLDMLLEEVSVMDDFDNDVSDKLIKDGWVAVCDDTGIIAYFNNTAEAYRYRLDYINRILN